MGEDWRRWLALCSRFDACAPKSRTKQRIIRKKRAFKRMKRFTAFGQHSTSTSSANNSQPLMSDIVFCTFLGRHFGEALLLLTVLLKGQLPHTF